MKATKLKHCGTDMHPEGTECSLAGKILKRTSLFLGLVLCFTACKKELNDSGESSNSTLSKSATAQTSVAGLTEIKVMSFNVRGPAENDPQTMEQRQGNILQIVKTHTPDVLGVQEFSYNPFEKWFRLKMDTLGYARYDNETSGLNSPKVIFWKKNRFTMVDTLTFKIDPIRTGTWVILRDNVNSKQYFFCNSHWSPNTVAEKSANAQAVIDMVQAKNPGLPAVIFGDFNSEPPTSQMANLRNTLGLTDALGDGDGEVTYHGFNDPDPDLKVDYLMCNKGFAYTSSFQVIKTTFNGFYPSDHYPIIATFTPAIFGARKADVNGKSNSAGTKYYFAKVNNDNFADKISWNPTVDGGKPKVYLSNGNGTFAATAVTHTASASTLTTTRYHFADVDGDGRADLIRWDPTLNAGHTRVYLAETINNGSFKSTVVDNPEAFSVGTTTVFNFTDVNGDGKADKIYWNSTVDGGKTKVFLATTGGNFNGTGVAGIDGASTTAGTTFYYADINGDGKSDKIMWKSTLNLGKPMVYLSNGTGAFIHSTSFSDSGASSVSADTRFYFADINGDGRAEKIYWNPTTYVGRLKVYYSQTTNVFDGAVYSVWGSSQSQYTNFYYADINGDGKADQNRWNYLEVNGEFGNYFAQ